MKIISNIKLFLFATFILGFLYPVTVFWLAEVGFSREAHGSILKYGGSIIGSELIGQNFTTDKYFQGRPSASEYNGLASGGTNLSPISKVLKEKIEKQKSLGFDKEMLFSSGSGLDPHISKESALVQVDRISYERKLSQEEKGRLIEYITSEAFKEDERMFGISKVNVLKLNRALDNHFKE